MNNILDNLKIYCAYHDKQIYDDYHLYNSNIIKTYFLLDKNIFDKWYIDNNKSLSEFQLILYIYENNIKSDYVGFCHYRRFWNYIDTEFIKNNNVYFYRCGKNAYKQYNSTCNLSIRDVSPYNYYLDKFEEFLNIYYKHLIPTYENYINSNVDSYDIYSDMFIMKWNDFTNFVKIIKEYLFYIFGTNFVNAQNVYQFINEKYGMWPRTLANFIEILTSILFNILYKDKIDLLSSTCSFCKPTDVILNYTGNENIESWIKKQYSIGIDKIIVINKSNNIIELDNYIYQDIYTINDKHNNININNLYDTNNLYKLYKENNLIFPNKCIILNNEEYLSYKEIIQFQNENWNNKQITNKKIIEFKYD